MFGRLTDALRRYGMWCEARLVRVMKEPVIYCNVMLNDGWRTFSFQIGSPIALGQSVVLCCVCRICRRVCQLVVDVNTNPQALPTSRQQENQRRRPADRLTQEVCIF